MIHIEIVPTVTMDIVFDKHRTLSSHSNAYTGYFLEYKIGFGSIYQIHSGSFYVYDCGDPKGNILYKLRSVLRKERTSIIKLILNNDGRTLKYLFTQRVENFLSSNEETNNE